MSQVTVSYANACSRMSLIIISPAMILAVLFLFCDHVLSGLKFSLLNGPPEQMKVKESDNTNQESFSRHLLVCLQVACTWRGNDGNVAVAFCLCL